MTAIGPEFYNFIKTLEENGDKLTSATTFEQPPDFQYHNTTCYVCNGYYGPNFGEPVCGTCHTFLFPDFPSYLPTSYFCSEKTDDGDSGNDEPSDLNYSSDRKVKLPAWWCYRNSLDSETSPEDEASRASNSGPGASSSGSAGGSSGGLASSAAAGVPGCSGSGGVSRNSTAVGVAGTSGIAKGTGMPKISSGVGLPGSSGILSVPRNSAGAGSSGIQGISGILGVPRNSAGAGSSGIQGISRSSGGVGGFVGIGMPRYPVAGVGVAGSLNTPLFTGIPGNSSGISGVSVGFGELALTKGLASRMDTEGAGSLESPGMQRNATSTGAMECGGSSGGAEVPRSSTNLSLPEGAGAAISMAIPGGEESAGQGPPPPPPNLARSLHALSTPRPPDNLAPGLVEQLPSEVLLCIFRYLDDLSLSACSCVCDRWWRLVRARVAPPRWAAFTAARWPLYRRLTTLPDWHKKYISLVESCFCRNCLVQMCVQAQPVGEENAWRRNRLRIELKMLRNDPPEGIAATPLDPKCCHWQASVAGPVGSPYEGGLFFLYIQVPYAYPMSPPVVRFLTRILHPNVSRHGDVGIDSVHHNWSLALTISKVLISIQSLLTDPYTAVCMEPELGEMYVRDRARFESLARSWTWRYAMLDILPY